MINMVKKYLISSFCPQSRIQVIILKLYKVMHLAAKSENIKIILELFPMFPHLLFTYNCDG